MKYYLKEDLEPGITNREQHELGRKLLEELLLKEAGLTGYTIAEHDGGKPYLKDHPEIFFNISHCRTCIAAAVSPHAIGVDAESRFEWKEPLARRISHPEEYRELAAAAGERQQDLLNLLWSRKEAFLKCLGEGIGFRRDLRDVYVGLEDAQLSAEEGVFQFLQKQTERYTLVICEQVQHAHHKT